MSSDNCSQCDKSSSFGGSRRIAIGNSRQSVQLGLATVENLERMDSD